MICHDCHQFFLLFKTETQSFIKAIGMVMAQPSQGKWGQSCTENAFGTWLTLNTRMIKGNTNNGKPTGRTPNTEPRMMDHGNYSPP